MSGQTTGNLDYLTHHGPDSREATTFPHIVFSAALRWGYIQMAFFFQDSQVGVLKLSQVGVLGLWTATAPRPELGSGRALNQSCSSRRELSNSMLHSLRRRREEVDSRLLVVGSQTGSLTPDPSFAHNLGYRCPNGQCKAILDIYASRDFHWYKERIKARRFWPLKSSSEFSGVPEDSKSPLLRVGVAFSHFAQSGVATSKFHEVLHIWCPTA